MSRRDELFFLTDILDSVNAILEFTSGLDLESFSKNRLVFRVDTQIVYNTIVNDLPLLKEVVTQIISDYRNKN